jgi:hypothetical protein
MKRVSGDEGSVVLELKMDEVAILQYAVSEILAKTEEWEFPILVGASVETARVLRDALRQVANGGSENKA